MVTVKDKIYHSVYKSKGKGSCAQKPTTDYDFKKFNEKSGMNPWLKTLDRKIALERWVTLKNETDLS